jgi:hypothetical protein
MAYLGTDPGPVLARGVDDQMFIERPQLHLLSDVLFHTRTAKSPYRVMQQWRTPGRPTQRNPMDPVSPGEWGPSHKGIVRTINWGMEFSFALEDLDDDPYGIMTRMVPLTGGACAHEFALNEEIFSIEMLANSMGSTTQLPTIDGAMLCSDVHPQVPGSTTYQSNLIAVPGDPDVASMEAARVALALQKSSNGNEYYMSAPKYLLCHPSAERVNYMLWNSTYDPFTADRNEDWLKKYNVRVVTSPYFTTAGDASTNAGFMLIGDRHYLYKDTRRAPRAASETNQHVQAVIVVITHRWVPYWSDWRGTAGSNGA